MVGPHGPYLRPAGHHRLRAVSHAGALLRQLAAGIFGASLAPYIATWLAKNWGLQYVGYYLCLATVLTLIGLLMIRETRDDDLHA